MIDEIYLSKRIEYSVGKVLGLTSESKAATTMLCFMIKSIAGNYKDIVAMYPVQGLNSNKILQCYNEVNELIHTIGFNLVGISVDNASCKIS